MNESTDVRLARMEEKLDFLLRHMEELCARNGGYDARLDELERDAVRTKTLFGVLGALWTLVAGLIGAWFRGLMR